VLQEVLLHECRPELADRASPSFGGPLGGIRDAGHKPDRQQRPGGRVPRIRGIAGSYRQRVAHVDASCVVRVSLQ